jgi:hypothetical protein
MQKRLTLNCRRKKERDKKAATSQPLVEAEARGPLVDRVQKTTSLSINKVMVDMATAVVGLLVDLQVIITTEGTELVELMVEQKLLHREHQEQDLL